MKKILLSLIVLTLSMNLSAQYVLHKIITQPDASGYLYRIIHTNDGGYAAAGFFTDQLQFDDNFMIAKFGATGEKLWMKALSSPDSEEFTDIIETGDEGIVAVGTGLDFETFSTQGMIQKFNINGQKAWCKTINANGKSTTARKIQQDDSGNLYVLGTVENTGFSFDYFLMKLDANGAILQQTMLGNSEQSELALSFVRTASGDFFVGGWGNNGTGENIQVMKLNSSLNIQWSKMISSTSDCFAYDMKEKANGNVVLSGRIDDGTTSSDVLILEINAANGDVVWAKQYSSSSDYGIFAYGLAVNSNDRIGLACLIEDWNSGSLVFETSSTGTVNWSKRVTSTNEISSFAYGINPTYDGGYIVCGPRTGIDSSVFQILKVASIGDMQCFSSNFGLNTTSLTLTTEDLTFASVASSMQLQDDDFTETSFGLIRNACFSTDVNEAYTNEELHIYPNPSSGNFTVIFPELSYENAIVLYDASGRKIYSLTGVQDKSIDLNLDLQPGAYFIRSLNNLGETVKKLMVY